MPIHLCGLVQYESARSTPALTHRCSGHRAAMPAMAASTCSHRPSRRHTSAMAGTGSKASDEVVPAVAVTKNGTQAGVAVGARRRRRGRRAAWRTCRRRRRGGGCRCRCRRCAAPSRSTSGPGRWRRRRAGRWPRPRLARPSVTRSRAARMAHRVASDAVPWMTPPPGTGRAEAVREVEQLQHPVAHERLQLGGGRAGGPQHAVHAETGARPARRGWPGTTSCTGSRRRSSGAASG